VAVNLFAIFQSFNVCLYLEFLIRNQEYEELPIRSQKILNNIPIKPAPIKKIVGQSTRICLLMIKTNFLLTLLREIARGFKCSEIV